MSNIQELEKLSKVTSSLNFLFFVIFLCPIFLKISVLISFLCLQALNCLGSLLLSS